MPTPIARCPLATSYNRYTEVYVQPQTGTYYMSDDLAIHFQDDVAASSFEASESLQCMACGRTFGRSNAYSFHVNSCRKEKKRMASALELAKETYRRKKLRLTVQPPLVLPVESSVELTAVGPSQEVSNICSSPAVILEIPFSFLTDFRSRLRLSLRATSLKTPFLSRNDAHAVKIAAFPCASEMNSQSLLLICLLLYKPYLKTANQLLLTGNY